MTGGTATSLFKERWLGESIRVTYFVPQPLSKQTSLASLIGLVPEQISDRPAQGIRQEIVSFGQGKLILGETPGRVDVIYAADQPQGLSPVVHVGPLEEAFSRCSDLGRQLCEKLGPVARLAIAPIAIRQLGSEREVAEVMLHHFPTLPVNLDTDSELAWRFSRRISATTFKGQINQVCNWQSMTTQVFTGSIPMTLPFSEGLKIFLLRAEIDINTYTNNPVAIFEMETIQVYQEVFERAKAILEGLA
ncbi:hypothetical protein [Rhodopila sp.]|uniref:hypothetical protein n=1 Tax=Rhodopila sp. TaxID=2480087 RepID=UPI003D0CFAD4